MPCPSSLAVACISPRSIFSSPQDLTLDKSSDLALSATPYFSAKLIGVAKTQNTMQNKDECIPEKHFFQLSSLKPQKRRIPCQTATNPSPDSQSRG